MRSYPAGWEAIWAVPHRVRYTLYINGVTYNESDIVGTPVIERPLMEEPTIGRCCTANLTLTIRQKPDTEIPKAAPIEVWCRLENQNGVQSDPLKLGKFYIVHREKKSGLTTFTAHDGMIKAGRTYLDKTQFTEWPVPMYRVVDEIAELMEVPLNAQSIIMTDAGYLADYPNEEMLMTEVLSSVAAAHGGIFIVNEEDELQLVRFPGTKTPAQDLDMAYVQFTLYSNNQKTVSRLTLNDDAGNQFTTGDDSGVEIAATCLYATQDMVERVAGLYLKNGTLYLSDGQLEMHTLTLSGNQLNSGNLTLDTSAQGEASLTGSELSITNGALNNETLYLSGSPFHNGTLSLDLSSQNGVLRKTFTPYALRGAYLNPCVTLGDTIRIRKRNGEIYDLIVSYLKIKCSQSFVCEVSNGVQDDDEKEYPYIDMQQQKANQYVMTGKSYFGNTITRRDGFVSELRVDEVPQARFVANAGLLSMQRKNSSGSWENCIYFDPIAQKYKIVGEVELLGVDSALTEYVKSSDLLTAGKTTINGGNLKTGTINAGLVTIQGDMNFFWSGSDIRIINPSNANKQVRIGKYGSDMGIGYTADGGKTWQSAIGFDGITLSAGSVTSNTLSSELSQTINGKANASDLNGLASEQFVTDKVAEISLSDDEIVAAVRSSTQYKTDLNNKANASDLNNYATKTYVTQEIEKSSGVTITDEYIISTVRKSQGYIDDLGNKVTTSEIISTINQSAELVKITAPKISLEGIITANGNIKIDAAGNLTANSGKFTNGTFSGTLTAGNWTFDSSGSKYSGNGITVNMAVMDGDFVGGGTYTRAFYGSSGCDVQYGADYDYQTIIRGGKIKFIAHYNGSMYDYDTVVIRRGASKPSGGTYADVSIYDDDASSSSPKGNLGTASHPWDTMYARKVFYDDKGSVSSSRSVKKDISPINDYGELLDMLKPVTYRYTWDADNHKPRYGLIYEDTVGILPDVCEEPNDNEDGRVGIYYDHLIPILLKEVQSLRRRVKTLEEAA